MGRLAHVLPVVGLATRTSSSQGTGFDVGEFIEGDWHTLVTARGTTASSIRFTWQSSFNGGNGSTAGRYVAHTSIATYSSATGHKRVSLTVFGKYGRVSWVIATASGWRFQSDFIGKT